MPPRINDTERPIIVSYTILPSQKQWLDHRARVLSLQHGQHISVSTILRDLIERYKQRVEKTEPMSTPD
jgi:hypothetical protein